MREIISTGSRFARWMMAGVCLVIGCKADGGAVEHKTLIPVADGTSGVIYQDDGGVYIPWGRTAKDAEEVGVADVAGDSETYDSMSDWDEVPVLKLPEIPSFSGGSCPTMQPGINGLDSAGALRQAQLYLPDDPIGKPVLFLWHDQGQNAANFAQSVGAAALAIQWDLVVVAPEGRPGYVPWGHGDSLLTEVDLLLFYDLISCLHDNFSVDRTRIYSMGQGVGASWGMSLVAKASEFLAASALFNVDIQGYAPAARAIPMVLTWGGPGFVFDLFGTPHDYEEIGVAVGTTLVAAGHSVLACAHTGGLNLPQSLLTELLSLLLDQTWHEPPGVFPSTAVIPADCTLN